MKTQLSVVLLSGMALLAALLYPYGHPGLAMSAFVLVLASFLVAFVAFNYQRSRSLGTGLRILVAAAPAVLAYFVCTTRQSFDDIIPQQIDGAVTRLYRSQNHQYPGAEVQDTSRGTILIEPIPEATWTRLQVGDHITKEAFTTYLTHRGERVPAVESSPLHLVRGASS